MVELNGVRIWAVGVKDGQALPPRKLICGTLAGGLDAMPGFPELTLPGRLEIPGRPGVWVNWVGWFELIPTGEVVAVYGAVVEAVGGSGG